MGSYGHQKWEIIHARFITLKFGYLNAVVDLVPAVHDQVASLGIHGVELAAGIGGLKHRDIIGARGDGVRETGGGACF